jgi:hypothetical protein
MNDATFACTVNVVCHASRCCPLHTPCTVYGICHASRIGSRRILCKLLVVWRAYRLGSHRIVRTCRAIFRVGISLPRCTPCTCSAVFCAGKYHYHRTPRILLASSCACTSYKALPFSGLANLPAEDARRQTCTWQGVVSKPNLNGRHNTIVVPQKEYMRTSISGTKNRHR